MRFIVRIIVMLVLLIVIAAGGMALYLRLSFPRVPAAADLHIEATPERIARGAYLANAVSSCVDCHSTRNWSQYTGPIVVGTEGMGGERFDETMGFPGAFYSPNITPAHLGSWTDGEILRAMTEGVSRDGRPLFPIMPYPAFGQMSEEDSHAIIAYLRTLAPIEHTPPASAPNFPMSLILRTMPKPATPRPHPDPSDTVAYGGYLVTIAACAECHTPAEKGKPLPGLDFAGGFEVSMPGGTLRSANITPDQITGIGTWTRERFIATFKVHATADAAPVNEPSGFNTIMPWTRYAMMTEQDLGAIYDYLRTIPAITHAVVTFTPKP